MRFRILDLILATAFIAGLLSAYSTDLIFFRQMLFLACTSVLATVGCLWFSKNRRPIRVGAIAGAAGGIAFTLITLFSPVSFYGAAGQFVSVSSPTEYATAELFLAPFMAMFLGAAIGPLVCFNLKGKTSPTNRLPHTLSWCFLGAACLLAFFSMKDRLEFGVSTRKWMYVVPLLLAIFVVHTTQWIQKEHHGK